MASLSPDDQSPMFSGMSMSDLTCNNGWLYLWLGSSVFYFVTLYASEDWSRKRKPQEPLHDRAFELIPRMEWMVYFTDGILLAGCGHLLQMIFWTGGSAGIIAKEACVYSAIGNFFSSSLHSVTLLPSSNHADGLPIFGGDADKLMSNHTFHFGLYLRIGCALGVFPLWALLPCVLLYSVCLAATRAHYAVDVVLAWWALLLVFVTAGQGYLPEEEAYCNASHQGHMDYSNISWAKDANVTACEMECNSNTIHML